jgi:hypothetical protein
MVQDEMADIAGRFPGQEGEAFLCIGVALAVPPQETHSREGV